MQPPFSRDRVYQVKTGLSESSGRGPAGRARRRASHQATARLMERSCLTGQQPYSGGGTSAPITRSIARALLTVSSNSRSGSESATIPAPTCTE